MRFFCPLYSGDILFYFILKLRVNTFLEFGVGGARASSQSEHSKYLQKLEVFDVLHKLTLCVQTLFSGYYAKVGSKVG